MASSMVASLRLIESADGQLGIAQTFARIHERAGQQL